ncbi:MAG TPA: helix-turn-helix transcriptional regulator, partial [Acidimicrobiales bacterium]
GARAEAAERALWSPPAAVLASLTRREHDVLVLVADGKTNQQIADHLSLSSRTVQKHLEHVYDKLAVRTRTAAAMKLSLGYASGGADCASEPAATR